MQEKITFKNSKGDRLVGVLRDDKKSSAVAVFVHGFATGKDSRKITTLEQTLNEQGIATFRFDIWAHGESDGDFENVTVSEAVDDVKQAVGFVQNNGYEKIGLYGSSFGGAACILAAPDSRLDCLVLISPVADYATRDTLEQNDEIKKWKEKGFRVKERWDGKQLQVKYSFVEDYQKLNGLESAKHISAPTMVIHGDVDESVPIELSKQLITHLPDGQLIIYPGCDHGYSRQQDFDKMITQVTEFFVLHLKD